MARPQAPRGHGRRRVIEAAVELFAEHGVTGTSLQMIADHLGVTKAAVYYQFHAKEDIVLAVLEEALVDMTAFVTAAEAEATPDAAATAALARARRPHDRPPSGRRRADARPRGRAHHGCPRRPQLASSDG